MALIKCPECGKEISDKAPHCIHCGYPMELIKEQIVKEEKIIKYRIYLNSCMDDVRADVIKTVSEITKKSLVEAKDLVNNLPICIVEDVTEDKAKEIVDYFDHNKVNIEYRIMEEGSPSELPFSLRKAKKVETASIISCPTCGMNVSSEAHSCPHCGHQFVVVKKGIGFWGVVGAIFVSVLLLLFF